jgi:hypothetical protein
MNSKTAMRYKTKKNFVFSGVLGKLRRATMSRVMSVCLSEDQYAFLIISRLILVRTRGVSDKT